MAVPGDQAALLAYVHARAADSGDSTDQASRRYVAALALSPNNEVLAARALAQALAAGDQALALNAAHILDSAGKLPTEGRLLLFADALRAGRWPAAEAAAAKLQNDEVFAFAAPILKAWTIQGSGAGDPFVLLDGLKGSGLGEAYATEQRPLLLLAGGRTREGLAALAPMLKDPGLRSDRLRIAAAAMLARAGDKAGAEGLLQGEADVLARARRSLASGRLDGETRAPAAGVADFLVRVAVDLNGQQLPDLAVDFARIATFLSPRDSEAWLLTGELLAGRSRHEAALAALSHVPADDPFADIAAEQRLALLVDADHKQEAAAQARAAADKDPGSAQGWIRLGDVLTRSERYQEAADAFGRALAARADAEQPRWGLLLLQGNALTQAGKWAEAKAALQQAYALAPHQPAVLNYLGYSQLERRENLDEAERLIREASKLQPDDAAITDSLGWALYVRGDFPQAIRLLEKAARGQPADASINEHLGDAYYSAGRRYEARYAWRAALVYADGKALERLQAKLDSGLRPDLSAP